MKKIHLFTLVLIFVAILLISISFYFFPDLLSTFNFFKKDNITFQGPSSITERGTIELDGHTIKRVNLGNVYLKDVEIVTKGDEPDSLPQAKLTLISIINSRKKEIVLNLVMPFYLNGNTMHYPEDTEKLLTTEKQYNLLISSYEKNLTDLEIAEYCQSGLMVSQKSEKYCKKRIDMINNTATSQLLNFGKTIDPETEVSGVWALNVDELK